MKQVKIAKLKSHLSSYLRAIQKGDEVVVTDRNTPIARVVPYSIVKEQILVLPAKRPPNVVFKIKIQPAPQGTNSLKALLEDRRDDLEE